MSRNYEPCNMTFPILMMERNLLIDPSHLYTLDLDVFGEHSLFQYINRTATPLANCILQTGSMHIWKKEAIEHRQEAIQELVHRLRISPTNPLTRITL